MIISLTKRPRLTPELLAFCAGTVGVLAGVLVDVVAWASVHDKDLAAAAMDADVTLAQVHGVVNSLFTVLLGVSAIGAVAWLGLLLRVLLLRTRRQCRPTRITATILAIIWMLLEIPSALGHVYGGSITAIPAVINEAALLVTLVCLYLPASSLARNRASSPPASRRRSHLP